MKITYDKYTLESYQKGYYVYLNSARIGYLISCGQARKIQNPKVHLFLNTDPMPDTLEGFPFFLIEHGKVRGLNEGEQYAV